MDKATAERALDCFANACEILNDTELIEVVQGSRALRVKKLKDELVEALTQPPVVTEHKQQGHEKPPIIIIDPPKGWNSPIQPKKRV